MRVFIGTDHAGLEFKEHLKRALADAGYEPIDCGAFEYDPQDDYPPFCFEVGERTVAEPGSLGVVIGGSGNGEQIAANKVRGARAALCHNEETARLARAHNDANVLALGGRLVEAGLALAIVDVFLGTGFDGGRHLRRVGQIAEIERQECDAMDGKA